MDEEEDGQVASAASSAPRKKSRLPWLIGLAVMLLVGGAGGYALFTQRAAQSKTPGAGDSAVKASKTEVYLALDPAFVVNFRDDDSLRYLQVGITLMAHDQAALDTAKSADPVLRDALVSLLSSQDYTVISGAAGREKLQAQALQAVRKVVEARLGRPGIDALYFTSFVMQ